MLYIILLLILAVLLFGSSAVIGVLGWILGFAVAAAALIWASIALDIGAQTWVVIGLGLVAAIGVVHYVMQAISRSEVGPTSSAAAQTSPPMSATYAALKKEIDANHAFHKGMRETDRKS